MSLGNNEKKMLRCMRSKQENIWTLEELLEITQWKDQVHVAGAGKSLDENEFVETIEKHMKFITLGSEGLKATENNLLEKRIWDWILSQKEDNRTMNELFKAGFGRHEAGPGIGLLKSLGVISPSGKCVLSIVSCLKTLPIPNTREGFSGFSAIYLTVFTVV